MSFQHDSQNGLQGPAERERAEEIAVTALGFIAANDVLLDRFLALTGIEAGAIRQAAELPGFLGGVLGFILAHEPTLMQFCSETGVEPESAVGAQRVLSGGSETEWNSV